MVVIKNNSIPYLDEKILNSYNNVTLLSTEGPQIKMNSLMLCALSHTLKMAFHEDDDDHTIITEFSLEELKQVKEFCMRGSCNATSEPILEAFGLLKKSEINLSDNNINEIKKEPLSAIIPKSKSVMKKFGLQKIEPTLNKISEKNNTSMTQIFESAMIKTEIEVKNEEIDVLDEPIEIENMEYDIGMDYSSDDSLLNHFTTGMRKKKSKQISNDLGSGIKVGKHMQRGKLGKKTIAENDANFKTFELPNPLEDYR